MIHRHSIGYTGREIARSGSVLIGVLWCVVLLAVLVLGLLHTTRLDLISGRYQTDRIQARYLSLAGIEKAKALLHQNILDRRRAGAPFSSELLDAPAQFRDVSMGRGLFRVIRPPNDDESGEQIYGVTDEESRLNINVADTTELTKIVGLTPDIAAAIVDWRDQDNTVTPGGAEADYYASLNPPYRPRNGPFPTVRELLMVRGIFPDQLLGQMEDSLESRSDEIGLAVSGAAKGTISSSEQVREGGWARLLTAQSAIENVDAAGTARVNVQSSDEAALTGIRGISTEIAKAIIAYRQQNPIRNLTDLLNVAAPPPNGANPPPGNSNNGPKVVDERLFKEIADHLTVEEQSERNGVVNINTAPVDVLQCLPGMTRPLAQAIVAHRRANGFFVSTADLLNVAGFNRDLLQGLLSRIDVRSDTFRIRSEGVVGKCRQTMEAVVRVRARTITTLEYREDDL